MILEKSGMADVEWIQVIRNRDLWYAVVNVVMKP
jgi:hypothetical protein